MPKQHRALHIFSSTDDPFLCLLQHVTLWLTGQQTVFQRQGSRVRVAHNKSTGQRPRWCTDSFNRCSKDALTAYQVPVKVGARARTADLGSVCKAACNHKIPSDPERWVTACSQNRLCLFAIDCGCDQRRVLTLNPSEEARPFSSLASEGFFLFFGFFVVFFPVRPLSVLSFRGSSTEIPLTLPSLQENAALRILTLTLHDTMH